MHSGFIQLRMRSTVKLIHIVMNLQVSMGRENTVLCSVQTFVYSLLVSLASIFLYRFLSL